MFHCWLTQTVPRAQALNTGESPVNSSSHSEFYMDYMNDMYFFFFFVKYRRVLASRIQQCLFSPRRWKNLGLSFTLLLSCYSAILVPAYLPTKQLTWTESSTEDYLVQS